MSNWLKYEEFMKQADCSVLDEIRLLSLDQLYRRTVEFHYNYHTLPLKESYQNIFGIASYEEKEILIEVQLFEDNCVCQPFLSFNSSELTNQIENKSFQTSDHPIWINILNLQSLSLIIASLQLNENLSLLFNDLRAHSTLIPFPGALFVSICTVRMIGSTAHLFKISMYADKRVLISYEREISPEIDIQETEESRIALENELRELLICSSINSREKKLVQRLKSGLGLGKKTDIDKENEDRMRESERGINEKSSENGKLDEKKKEELIWREIVSHHIAIESLRAKECRENIASFVTPQDNCSIKLFRSKLQGKKYQQSRKKDTGLFLLLFEIILFAQSSSDNVTEVMSRALSHMQTQVYSRVSVSEKRRFYYQLTNLLFAVKSTKRLIDDIKTNFNRLTDLNHVDYTIFFSSFIPIELHEIHFTLSILINSFTYQSICLSTQIDDVLALESVMTHMNTMSAESTSKNLGLVATVFLPLTFLAGVFGMNFQEDGGYTMGVLNAWYGPEVFWALCFVVVCMNLYFFLINGLVNLRRDSHSWIGYSFDDADSDVITTDRDIRQKKTQQLERVNSLLMKKMESNNHLTIFPSISSKHRNFNE